jgi:ribosome-binding protein aMBF1 (putative translation factor)
MLVLTKMRSLMNEGKGWSMSKLAREAELNTSTVSMTESGRFKPYPSQLEKMAKALKWQDDPEKLLEEFVAADRTEEEDL